MASIWEQAQDKAVEEIAGTSVVGGGATAEERVRMQSSPDDVRAAREQLDPSRLTPAEQRGLALGSRALDIYDELSPAAPAVQEETPVGLLTENQDSTPDMARDRRADMVAVIAGGVDDLDVFETNRQSVLSDNIEQSLRNVASNSSSEKELELATVTAEFVRNAGSMEELEEAVALGDILRSEQKAKEMGLIEESEFLDAVANYDEMGQDDIDNESVNLRIVKDVEDMVADIGLGQTLWDFANILFMPGDVVEDAEDLVGVSGLFAGREELQKAVLAFYTMDDPQEKLFYWDQLKGLAQSKLNPTEAAGLLATFATGQFTGSFEEYSALGVGESAAALIPVLGTGGRALRSLGTTARVAHTLGNYRAAAKMAAKALKSGTDTGARNAGTAGRTDAADAASPLKIRGVSENDMTGLAPAIQADIQQEAAVMRQVISDITEGRAVVTPRAALRGERSAAEMSIWNQGRNIVQHTKGDIANIELRRTADDTVEMTLHVIPKGTADLDQVPAAVRQVRATPKRTDAQRNVIADVDGQAQRIKSQRITAERKQEKLLGLMNKKSFRDTVGTLAINTARASKQWPTILKDMQAGKWKAATQKIIALEKGPVRAWNDIKGNPAFADSLRLQVRDLWKESQGAAPKQPKVDIRTHTIKARVSDYTGTLTQDELPAGNVLLSNRAVARSAEAIETYEGAGILDNVSSRVYNLLTRMVNDTYDGLAKTARVGKFEMKVPLTGGARKQRVSKALLDGDEVIDPETGVEVGKVWSPEELRTKFQLDENEQAAYYKLRMMFDHLHVLKNDAARRELLALGYRDVRMRGKMKYKDADGTDQTLEVHDIGRPYDNAQVAWRQAEGDGISEVFDFGTGTAVPYKRETVQLAYEKTQQLVRLRNPFKDPRTGKRHQYVLASVGQEIRDLPQEVLAYKPGYVPRSYDRGVWFVKAFPRDATIDGRNVGDRAPGATQGMSDTRRAANRLADNLNMEGDGSVTYRAVAADQMDPIELMTAAPTGGGRLYVSGRGDRPIPFYKEVNGILTEEKASRVDALEALQGNISNISYHYPRNEWRIAQALRLENTAKKLGVQYNGLHALAQDAGGGPKAVAFVNRQRTNLRDWLAAPDDAEVWWNNTIQSLYESAVDKNFHTIATGLWWMKSKNPLTAIRGATFHLMLGMLNPVQTFVQAQGAAVAMSMHISRNLSKMFGLAEIGRTYKMQAGLSIMSNLEDNMLSAAALELRRTKMITGVEADEMFVLADAFKRSGLKDGVLTNADFSAMEQGFGQVMNAAARTADKALYFYRTGELFNRRFSFTTAFREFVEANPQVLTRNKEARMLEGGGQLDKLRLTNDEVLEITARANDFMLNLGRANRAAWQKGLLSVPTQFWQVQAKLIEELLLGGIKTDGAHAVFTRKERMKLMIGQIGLYGAAGMPIIGPALSYNLDYNDTGIAADPDSIANRTFDEGAWGLVFATLGADVEVSKRGAILNDLQDLAYDYILGDKTTAEAMTGAFNSIAGRTADGWKRLQPLALSMVDPDIPVTQEDFLVAMDAIGDLSTSWTNASKAYTMLMYDQSFSRSGRLLATENFNPQTVVATAMGFAPRKDTQSYDLLTMDRMYTQKKADTKRSIRKLMLDYVSAASLSGDKMSEKLARKLQMMAWFEMHYIRPDERMQMLEDIRQEISEGKSDLAKGTQRLVQINMEAYLDEAFSFYEQAVIGQMALSEEDIK